jgi:hypothetical protein
MKAKVITLSKPGMDPKFPQNLHMISLLSTLGKQFEKVILKIDQRHTEERGVFNASQSGFCARHSMTLQCMRPVDHVTSDFNNKMYMAAVFLDIEKAFDTTWHLGLLYELSRLKFSISLIKFISSFSEKIQESQSKVKCLCQGIHKQGYHKVLSCPPHYTVYTNDMPQISGVYVGLFADDTCIYATDHKEGYVLRKLQQGLRAIET